MLMCTQTAHTHPEKENPLGNTREGNVFHLKEGEKMVANYFSFNPLQKA